MAVNELFALPLALFKVLLALLLKLVKLLLAFLLELVEVPTVSSPLGKGRHWRGHRHNYAKNGQQQNAWSGSSSLHIEISSLLKLIAAVAGVR